MDMDVYFGESEKDFDLLSPLVGFATSATSASAAAAAAASAAASAAACQWPMRSG
jgi:hypothetical protein